MNPQKQPKPDRQQNLQQKRKRQKTKQQIFLHFLQLYQPHPKQIQPSQVPHEVQHLYQLISQPPKNRNNRILKKIKSELSQMKCFKVPANQNNAEFIQIFKRDHNNVINMIAPFIHMTKYAQGAIVQATAVKRRSIKILLMGEVVMFQPINYKAFKNCQQKLKRGQILLNIINGEITPTQAFQLKKSQNPQQFQQLQEPPQQQQQSPQSLNRYQSSPTKPANITQQLISSVPLPQLSQQKIFSLILQALSVQKCRQLLTKCNIITPLSPHKQSKRIKIYDFLFQKDQPMFIDQKNQYYASTICSTDCVFIEIGYQICKDIISLINTDRQRPFIQTLLFKFPMLRYFQAKQYVTQQFMIAHQILQEEETGVKTIKKAAVQIIKQLKVVSSLNFELTYNGQLYLIISGNVTLIVDQISQRKPSTIQYAKPLKSVRNKEILYLYKNDIFGFEEIGKNKLCNLRYLVSNGAKLLRINNNVMKIHLETVKGFKQEFENIYQVRNKNIAEILAKMQQSLQNQQISRHQSITYSNSQLKLAKIKPTKSMQLTQNQKQIKQLKYYGNQDYESASLKIRQHFSPQNTNLPKQTLSPEIVKQSGLGIQFAVNLLKKPDERIQIKDGWIQIRNKKGNLLRRKRLKQTDKSVGDEEKGDSLLRRLGILSSKEIADHNLEMVRKRPSKYEFEDLQKEAKQFKKIRQQASSLPKLTKYFAKKEDRLFTILYKKTHL